MELQLVRINSMNDFTLGVLYDVPRKNSIMFKQKHMLSFTIEDEHRTKKVYSETRIPSGRYRIKLRKYGGFNERYSARFEWHEGMLEICDVPNFTDVLIHIGNDDDDTAGCLLTARTADMRGFIGGSTEQYEKVYKHILPALKQGEDVWVEYIDYDFI
jgi:hypothetical protein